MTTIEELIPDPVSVDGIATLEQAEQRGFELYREATTYVGIAASSYKGDSENDYPLDRNGAIASALLMRVLHFMRAVLLLSGRRDDGGVIHALTRCIFESVTNLEFLVRQSNAKAFDGFVERSFGPEVELYSTILSNIKERGETLPIEQRMIASINDVVRASGKTIDELKAIKGGWGGNVRQRLESIDKSEMYTSFRLQSHAIHGTWVDLAKNYLVEREQDFMYRVRPHKDCDARLLTPMCVIVLDALAYYLVWRDGERTFGTELLLVS